MKTVSYLLFFLMAFTVFGCIVDMNDDYDKNVEKDFSGTGFYVVSGKIINASDTGVAGVTVVLSGSDELSTTTDASGNYSFADVPEGEYEVEPDGNYASMSIDVIGGNVQLGSVRSGGHGGKQGTDFSCSLCH